MKDCVSLAGETSRRLIVPLASRVACPHVASRLDEIFTCFLYSVAVMKMKLQMTQTMVLFSRALI